jgi:hypothetical protein
MTDQVERVVGKYGVKEESHQPEVHLHRFFTGASAPTPVDPSGDVTGGITDLGMMMNDKLGCCGVSAFGHYSMTSAVINAGIRGDVAHPPVFEPGFVRPSDAQIEEWYYAYGEAMGWGVKPNLGVINSSFLKWLYDNKLIEGYGEFDLTQPGAWDAIHHGMEAAFGVLVCCTVTKGNESQYVNNQPWDVNGDPTVAGLHDVLLGKFGPNTNAVGTCGTWGIWHDWTAAWQASQVTEAWCIFTLEAGKRAGYDVDALVQVLDSLPGSVVPVVAPSVASETPLVVDSEPSEPVDAAAPARIGFLGEIDHLVHTEFSRVMLMKDLHKLLGSVIAGEAQNLVLTELQALAQRYAGL